MMVLDQKKIATVQSIAEVAIANSETPDEAMILISLGLVELYARVVLRASEDESLPRVPPIEIFAESAKKYIIDNHRYFKAMSNDNHQGGRA